MKCPHCHQSVDCSGLSGIVVCPHCKKRFTCTPSTPAAVPPLPGPIPAQSEVSFDFETPVTSSHAHTPLSSTRRLSKTKKPKNVLDFIDVKFQHYLTPIIIKVIWVSCLCLAALGLVGAGFYTISSMLPESSRPQQSRSRSTDVEHSWPSSTPSVLEQRSAVLVYKIIGWISAAIVTAIGLLITRVICESIIVLFNIAESLASLDRKTATR